MSVSAGALRRWRLLAQVLAGLFAFSLIFGAWEVTAGTVYSIAVSLLCLFGLYGYAWQKRIYRRWLWQVLLVMQLSASVFVAIGFVSSMLGGLAEGSVFFTLILVVMVSVQGLVAYGLFLYAFKSPNLWGGT